MKKRLLLVMTVGIMTLSVVGCGNKNIAHPAHTKMTLENEKTAQAGTESATAVETSQAPQPARADQAADSGNSKTSTISFADLSDTQFVFCSGAGGWATYMTVDADGTFSGEYFDGEMGATGENYPNGTMYQCDFTGQFTPLVKVNDYTYSTTIQEIRYEKEPGTEEIKDGVRYCYSDAYGLDGAKDMLLYLPGAPLSKLPEGFRSWVGYYDLSMTSDTELPFYGLYNEAREYGFYSEYHNRRLIDSQSFPVSLDGWGNVTFASYLPEDADRDVEFKLLKDGQTVYTFPDSLENTFDANLSFQEIMAVAFRDIDGDDRLDILILNQYTIIDGANAGQPYPAVRIYSQPEGQKEFVLNKFDPPMDEFLQKQKFNRDMATVYVGIEEYWNQVKGSSDPYTGEYLSRDTEEPNLKIVKQKDGTYRIEIEIFRLVGLEGTGTDTGHGIEFSAMLPNGRMSGGTITLEGNVAVVTFTDGEWSTYSNIKEYRYDKIDQ